MTTHELAPSVLTRSSGMSTFSSMATSSSGPPVSLPRMENVRSGYVPQPLLSVGPSSAKQVEMMDRLKQLLAWQEKQKSSLLRQQQEEIIRLRQQGSKNLVQDNGELHSVLIELNCPSFNSFIRSSS